MKIWHDNSGKGDNASWFLKYIIIYELHTKEKFYSICENWLAVEKGDGKIERNLIFVPEKKFKELKRQHESFMDKLSDLHLWYSVYSKPIGSLFTRLNRVTCCFLCFYSSMFMITSYYVTNFFHFYSSKLLNLTLVDLTYEQVEFLKNNSAILLRFRFKIKIERIDEN
jgi:polycystin 1L2